MAEMGTYTYTDAPEVYDGFGTQTVENLAGCLRGRPVRKVATPIEYAEWQRNRYASGGYVSEPGSAMLDGGK